MKVIINDKVYMIKWQHFSHIGSYAHLQGERDKNGKIKSISYDKRVEGERPNEFYGTICEIFKFVGEEFVLIKTGRSFLNPEDIEFNKELGRKRSLERCLYHNFVQKVINAANSLKSEYYKWQRRPYRTISFNKNRVTNKLFDKTERFYIWNEFNKNKNYGENIPTNTN